MKWGVGLFLPSSGLAADRPQATAWPCCGRWPGHRMDALVVGSPRKGGPASNCPFRSSATWRQATESIGEVGQIAPHAGSIWSAEGAEQREMDLRGDHLLVQDGGLLKPSSYIARCWLRLTGVRGRSRRKGLHSRNVPVGWWTRHSDNLIDHLRKGRTAPNRLHMSGSPDGGWATHDDIRL